MHWVSMMVFITLCCRKLRRQFERRLLALALTLLAGAAVAGVELGQLRLDRQEQGLVLHAHLRLELGATVEDALMKGVAVHFVAEADLMQDRWYWYDRKVAQVSRYYRLAYQPLTRQWRLQVASEPMAMGAATTSLAQTFDSLQAALDVIRLQSGLKLTETGDVQSDVRQYVVYRFRLDMSQLPRPFQIAAGSQSGWNLNLSQTMRIQPEGGN
jgi:hypothetical protein